MQLLPSPLCLSCQEPRFLQTTLCLTCLRLLLVRRKVRPLVENDSLFFYQGIIKTLIRSVKIEKNAFSSSLLCDVALRQNGLGRIMTHIDIVMPAPSSLWSRVHGKIDLAYDLASTLAKTFKKKLVRPPYLLGWNWTKQSMKPYSLKKDTQEHVKVYANHSGSNILIVDDVRTSGSTLQSLINSLKADSIFTLTLAQTLQPQT